MSIDHEFTKDIVCPWCGGEQYDDDGHFMHADEENTECEDCGRGFSVTGHVQVTYTTKREPCAVGSHDYRFSHTVRRTRDFRPRDPRAGGDGWVTLPVEEHTDLHVFECSVCEDCEYKDGPVGSPRPNTSAPER